MENGITKEERALIGRVAMADGMVVESIERASLRPYDLHFKGIKSWTGKPVTVTVHEAGEAPKRMTLPGSGSAAFSAWLPLAAIRALPAADYATAVEMSDYPQMGGDWSGIRDSEPDVIWSIFEALCV
jgi:hypothetical protein